MKGRKTIKNAGAFLSVWLPALAVQATELVYVPVNPVFGGNPLNGSTLLGVASAINKHKDPSGTSLGTTGLTPQSALDQFNEILQRTMLSRIAAATTSGIVGSDGRLIPGQVETTDFQINIADLGGGLLQITTTDKSTGASTSFQVSQ